MPLDGGSHGHPVGIMTGHPQWQRLERAAQGVGRLRIEDPAQTPAREVDAFDQIAAARHDARRHVAVAVEVLRGALHRQVNP